MNLETIDPPQRCTHCGSSRLVFKERARVWECNDCEERFDLPGKTSAVKSRVFLSYGHDANEPLVKRIKADLEAKGHEVWFDRAAIKAGDDWRRAITDGIVGSDWMISFLSRYSTRDPGVCLDEVGIALGVKGGIVQTVLVESESDVSPPLSVGHIQWLDMHDWRARQASDPAGFEPWYQDRFGEIARVIESDSNRRFAGEIEALAQKLQPLACDTRIGSLLNQGFIGRVWLVEEIERWRTVPTMSRLFFIAGEPGIGKSALSAWLVHHGKAHIIAAQFVEYDQPGKRDPRRIVQSIAFQIATRLPDYRRFLIGQPVLNEIDSKNAAELFDELLAKPLKYAIQGGRERYLILVDALDEAGDNGPNELLDLLAQQAAKLPEWIGFVVTSRPEPEILRALSHLVPHKLAAADPRNAKDLRAYFEAWLKKRPTLVCDCDRIPSILAAADGNFLYLRQFCDGVDQGWIDLARPESFPKGMTSIFGNFFARRFPDLAHFERSILPLLEIMLAAREPMLEASARAVLGWSPRQLDGALLALGSLLTMRAGRPHFFHKSLSDWLLDPGRAGAYRAYVDDGNRQIGKLPHGTISAIPEGRQPLRAGTPARAFALSRAIRGVRYRSSRSRICRGTLQCRERGSHT